MSLHRTTSALVAMGFAVAAVPAAQADVLANYTFDGSFTSSDTDSLSTASGVSVGSGLTTSFIDNWRGTFLAASADTTAGSEDDSLADEDYVSFTVTPESGYMLNLENLTFDASTSWGGSTNASWDVALYSSVDGFTSGAWLHQYGEPDGSQGLNWVPQDVDLSGAEFQGLTDPVEFRIYVWDGAGSSSSHVDLDSVALNGTTAEIPEPASVALLGLGGVMVLARRRREA